EARTAGVRLAIATTTTPENVEALIESALPKGAMDWFEVVGAGDIVPHKKPAADIYIWVLEKMGLQASQVIVFEDSAHGLTAARGAGIERVVVTVNDYTRAQDFSGARVVLENLGEPGMPAGSLFGRAPSDGFVDLAFLRELAGPAEATAL
ncbi:MAG: HAD-IA family hydrolase, partial [Sedimenticolaceae bacterium]